MLRLIRYLFIISTTAIDCLRTYASEMTYCVLSGMLNTTNLLEFPIICLLLMNLDQRTFTQADVSFSSALHEVETAAAEGASTTGLHACVLNFGL